MPHNNAALSGLLGLVRGIETGLQRRQDRELQERKLELEERALDIREAASLAQGPVEAIKAQRQAEKLDLEIKDLKAKTSGRGVQLKKVESGIERTELESKIDVQKDISSKSMESLRADSKEIVRLAKEAQFADPQRKSELEQRIEELRGSTATQRVRAESAQQELEVLASPALKTALDQVSQINSPQLLDEFIARADDLNLNDSRQQILMDALEKKQQELSQIGIFREEGQ